ncbi:uncharacterized protein PSFLO_03520 [Pseudozyma flocculosa]|uniref:Uncharacterized protein n=1 Tax=Pseudozyma flocculosa TaxID=84751 RepID=A0A5C3F0K3_9BASI|nr:uncharacterized protein PSFLO_03520 [Pseudozyma flocculosa]
MKNGQATDRPDERSKGVVAMASDARRPVLSSSSSSSSGCAMWPEQRRPEGCQPLIEDGERHGMATCHLARRPRGRPTDSPGSRAKKEAKVASRPVLDALSACLSQRVAGEAKRLGSHARGARGQGSVGQGSVGQSRQARAAEAAAAAAAAYAVAHMKKQGWPSCDGRWTTTGEGGTSVALPSLRPLCGERSRCTESGNLAPLAWKRASEAGGQGKAGRP